MGGVAVGRLSADLESVRWVGCHSFLDTVPLSFPRPWPSFVADQPPSTFAPGPPLPPSGPSSCIMAPRPVSYTLYRRLPFHDIRGRFLGFRFRVGADIPRTTIWARIWSGMDLRVA